MDAIHIRCSQDSKQFAYTSRYLNLAVTALTQQVPNRLQDVIGGCSHIPREPQLNMDDGDGREGEQKGDRGWCGVGTAYGKDLRGMSMKCAKTGSSQRGDIL